MPNHFSILSSSSASLKVVCLELDTTVIISGIAESLTMPSQIFSLYICKAGDGIFSLWHIK